MFLELGPGKALTGFIRRIDNSIRAYNVEDLNTLERISENILSGKE